MEITKIGLAGTLESSDALVTVEPNKDGGIKIYIQSTVKKQFGEQILEVVQNTLGELNVTDGLISINDKGALDCVIKSRVQTAVYRAADSTDYKW